MQDASTDSTPAERVAIAPAQPPRWPDLTPKQTAFVEHYVWSGGKVMLSARKAGYSSPQTGSTLLRLPHILKAISELQHDRNTSSGVEAIGVMMRLMKRAKSDYVRLEAAKAIVALSPFQPPERHLHKVSGDLSVSFDTGVGVENGEYRDVTPLSRIESPAEAPQPEDE